ncbi:MAG: hypothetical protein R3C14_44435 [Caldilineaceae bacterium]
MKVKPMLGGWEIPRIAAIQSLERRSFVELAVPGRSGSLFQDMNATPTRIAIRGSLFGDDPRDEFFNEVRGKFRAGTPITFVADIITATEVQYVIIETLDFQESGIQPDETEYHIVLRESPPPPPPPDPLGGLDTSLLDQAGNFLDSVTSALDVIEGLGNVPDIGDPTPRVRAALDQVRSATSGLQEAATLFGSLFGDE